MLIVSIIVVIIFLSPVIVLFQWLYNTFDKFGMRVESLKTTYLLSETNLIGFAGAYECNSFRVYIAAFSISNQTFAELISEDLLSVYELEVNYVIGRSKKIYIKEIKSPTKGDFFTSSYFLFC